MNSRISIFSRSLLPIFSNSRRDSGVSGTALLLMWLGAFILPDSADRGGPGYGGQGGNHGNHATRSGHAQEHHSMQAHRQPQQHPSTPKSQSAPSRSQQKVPKESHARVILQAIRSSSRTAGSSSVDGKAMEPGRGTGLGAEDAPRIGRTNIEPGHSAEATEGITSPETTFTCISVRDITSSSAPSP